MTLIFPSTSPFSELLRLALGGKRPNAPMVDQGDATAQAVDKLIRNQPGLLITEIETRLPWKSREAIRAAVKRLKASGSVRVEGPHNQFRYFPGGDK